MTSDSRKDDVGESKEKGGEKGGNFGEGEWKGSVKTGCYSAVMKGGAPYGEFSRIE